MKKIFAGIGVLVAFFSIFFFLLVADKMVYNNNQIIYNFKLSKSISGQELKKYAENVDIVIRLVDFKNTSFGKKELNITFINPDSSINLGKQPSVFPNNRIAYQVFDEKTQIEMKYFTIQNNDYDKIEKMTSLLEKNGYSADVLKDEPISFNYGMLFSSLNIGFFALVTILLILSIATYYVYRLKEIGILKLIGWSNRKISFRLLFKLLIHLYLSSLLFIIPFGIYVIVSDVSKIMLYARIYFLLCIFLAFVFLLSSVVATFFIHNVNRIGAIKNNKNNKLIFYVLLLFKIVTTFFLALAINNSINNISILDSTIHGIEELHKYNLYSIRTSVIPEEEMHKKLDQLVGSLDDKNVFNYSSPERLMNIVKLKLYQKKGKLRDSDECTYTSISANMLEILNILDVKGNKIQVSQIDETANTLLVPIHLKGDIKKILDYFQLEKDTTILYIQNGQIHNDILYPSLYVYDSIYFIHKLQKLLYLNNGEVLINKKSAELVKQGLKSLCLDNYSIAVDSLNIDYNNLKANAQLDLCESLFHMIINILSYLLCLISIITVFLELRKKEFGVYKLIGRYPSITIVKFMCTNGLITILIAWIVNPIFLLLLLIEVTIYEIFIYKYMRNKAILSLKGE